jgi:hypothetical protein
MAVPLVVVGAASPSVGQSFEEESRRRVCSSTCVAVRHRGIEQVDIVV